MFEIQSYLAIIIGSLAFGFMYAAAKDLWKGRTQHTNPGVDDGASFAVTYRKFEESRSGVSVL